ncbi:hypothetical protein NECAME_00875 [Necator americanus]|uniref:Uncharacterized protein n=1 Tax=Necator americanus TaxID=51031 RepID=W2SQN7_NECAM|nr:hypothetical protein NECAME_00875 [Necator americanus]ETN71186.1 hypothetical protein NECAME_00875 [Necator americanus]
MKHSVCPPPNSVIAITNLSSRDNSSSIGFTHLGGATQFAVIRRKHSELSVVLPCIPSSPYKKVGEAIAKNSLFSLEREKLKQAFILWLQRNPLREENLLKTYIGSYWRIRISSIVDLIELPHPLKKKMNRKDKKRELGYRDFGINEKKNENEVGAL